MATDSLTTPLQSRMLFSPLSIMGPANHDQATGASASSLDVPGATQNNIEPADGLVDTESKSTNQRSSSPGHRSSSTPSTMVGDIRLVTSAHPAKSSPQGARKTRRLDFKSSSLLLKAIKEQDEDGFAALIH